jgi:hypothetical protein
MKMFKLFSKTTPLAFLILAAIIVSCKSDDPTPTPVDNNPIVGSWQYVSVAPETAGTTIVALSLIPTVAPCIGSLVFKFESNNKVSASGCDAAVQVMTAAGYITVGSDTKWKVENSKLKLTNGTTVQELPITQQATQMTITVNTNTDKTIPAVNAIITLKKI